MISFEGSEQSILQKRPLARSRVDGLWGTSSGLTTMVQWMSVCQYSVLLKAQVCLQVEKKGIVYFEQ